MKWTPKKTRIVLITLALLLDLALGWIFAGYPIVQKAIIVIGVLLVLAYVKAVDAKEDTDSTDHDKMTP